MYTKRWTSSRGFGKAIVQLVVLILYPFNTNHLVGVANIDKRQIRGYRDPIGVSGGWQQARKQQAQPEKNVPLGHYFTFQTEVEPQHNLHGFEDIRPTSCVQPPNVLFDTKIKPSTT
jgi:hypothetical protein